MASESSRAAKSTVTTMSLPLHWAFVWQANTCSFSLIESSLSACPVLDVNPPRDEDEDDRLTCMWRVTCRAFPAVLCSIDVNRIPTPSSQSREDVLVLALVEPICQCVTSCPWDRHSHESHHPTNLGRLSGRRNLQYEYIFIPRHCTLSDLPGLSRTSCPWSRRHAPHTAYTRGWFWQVSITACSKTTWVLCGVLGSSRLDERMVWAKSVWGSRHHRTARAKPWQVLLPDSSLSDMLPFRACPYCTAHRYRQGMQSQSLICLPPRLAIYRIRKVDSSPATFPDPRYE